MDSIFITPNLETQELIAEFTVAGEPISKARARFTKRGSKTVAYTPQKTLDGEASVKAAFLSVTHKIGTDANDAYAVRAHFYNGTRQRRDVDNMVKLILDGLNKVAWVDDNQVLEIAARKSFVTKAEARTVVQVFRIGEMEFPSKPCLRCGTEFRTYESWDNDPNGKKYCSRECFYETVKDVNRRNCKHCGNEFQSRTGSKATMYCSRECSSEGRRTVTTCAICKADFSIQDCHVGDRNYCSDECIREQDRLTHKERRSKYFPGTCSICGSGTTRKEYERCNPCKLKGAKGKPTSANDRPAAAPKPRCSADGCAEASRTKGMCGKHYMRNRRLNQA